MAEKLSGRGVKEVEYHRSDSSDDGHYIKRIRIWFDSPPPSSISINTHFENLDKKNSYVQIDNKKKGSLFEDKELTKAQFGADCNFKSARTWEYNDRDLLWRRQWLDVNGKVKRTVFTNRAAKSLEEIYGDCGKYLSKIQEIANRTDRILVTILDSGVDYNHTNLAFKIARPSITKTSQRQIERLKEEKRELKKEYDGLWKIQKLWYNDEYNSKLKNINDSIAQGAIGWDFRDDDDQPYDYIDSVFNMSETFDHGTHVAGIASQGTSDISILPLRHPGSEKARYYDSIELAYKRGSRIVNISLGSDDKDYWRSLSKAIEDHPDMLFVVSAGNAGDNLDNSPHYPAAYDHPNMLVVAAVNENNNLSDFSNYSKAKVDLAAPGEDIDSLEPGNIRGKKSGTSMAAPYVTRVAAKVKFINPALTPRQIISIIRDSVTPVDSLKFKVKYGGVVNEEKALAIAQGTLK